ncbi:MAG TPA: primosomal protein N' [Terriglobales bacterium]|nr:primosomal protein N' [Terriglobales bacterium]
MPEFCDIALPVPLDTTFTYRIPAVPPDIEEANGNQPVVGGRVLVPFREQRLSGVVVSLHDREPTVQTKAVLKVLDAVPVLNPDLMRLAQWISEYYLAPLGEVFRTMLPLAAEFKRDRGYQIADAGRLALHLAGMSGASTRSHKPEAELAAEYEVLEYLAEREIAREGSLISGTSANKATLDALARRKWISRHDLSATREAGRTIKVATLVTPLAEHNPARALNPNQRTIVEAIANAGGKLQVESLRELKVPRSTLQTLAKRGLVEISEQPAGFSVSTMRPRLSPSEFQFTAAQQNALTHINSAVEERKFAGFLLHGVTGSGKTAAYLASMQAVLQAGRSAILLVPEIGLTPAVAADLHRIFADQVAILHSGLSDQERAEQWHRIHRGEARIVVGTRSAVFAPVTDLALMVVDEEQDGSYKQEEMPRYNARDVAVMRAKMTGAVVVLGSATPSLESYYNAQNSKYSLIELPDRVEKRPLPEVEIVDMRTEFQETGAEQVISRKLAAEIAERLTRGEQVMILLNRRGYSPVVLCRACGHTVECENCAIAMTHHKSARRLECHYCGQSQPVPKTCAKCGSEYVQFVGTGSEKLEELLRGMFPQARIGRLDRDTVRGRHDFERMLNALDAGELDLLVGTQMIAKGHDVHGVTLVGVVGADIALGLPDFRAAERTFQLLTQVAGRAGRGGTPGKVVLQTYFPDHYAVQFAAQHDFRGFYDKELRYRSWMHYPPFGALANVLVCSPKLDDALKYSGLLGRWFEKTSHVGVRVLGPAAAPIVRLKRDYRYHFVLKSSSRQKLNSLLRAMLAVAAQEKMPHTSIIVDVDALWLL